MRHQKLNNDEIGWYISLSRISGLVWSVLGDGSIDLRIDRSKKLFLLIHSFGMYLNLIDIFCKKNILFLIHLYGSRADFLNKVNFLQICIF